MSQVTVIVPTFNRERPVERAVNSILAQSFTDFELIVVDDGSTDGTRARLAVYGERIRYIYQENRGVSAARNAGIKAAHGDWVAFLDSDDEWMTDYLAIQMKGINENPTLCMQSTDACVVGLNGERQRYFEINRCLAEFGSQEYLIIGRPFSFIVQHAPWQIGSTMIRRTAIQKAGLFDVCFTLSEDLELMARVGLEGSFGLIPKVLVSVYRRNEAIESLTTQAKHRPVQSRMSDEKIYDKLHAIGTLTPKERRAVGAVASANRRAIGNLLLQRGDLLGARDAFARAVALHPSMKSVGKYLFFRACRVRNHA